MADKPQTLKRVSLRDTPSPKGVGGLETLNPKTNGWLRLRVGVFEAPKPYKEWVGAKPQTLDGVRGYETAET